MRNLTNRGVGQRSQTPDELLTKSQLAKLMKVCNRQIEIMANQKIIPTIRFGRCVRYNWEDVIEALDRHQEVGLIKAGAKTTSHREQDQA
jgi:hypothetical protein